MSIKKIMIILCTLISSIITCTAVAEIYTAISGKVISDETGKGVEGVDVNAFWSINGSYGQEHTVTNKDGQYFLKNLKSGTYSIGFIKKNSPYLSEDPNLVIDLPKGKNIVNANFVLKLGGSLSGVVYDADGMTPLDNVDVTVIANNPLPKDARNIRTTRTDINGKYRIQGLPGSDAGKVEVDIVGHPKLTKTIILERGVTITGINFIAKWDPTTGISGYVKSSIDNKPISKAEIIIRDNIGNDIARTNTDSTGRYLITGLSSGTYKIITFWPEGGSFIKKSDIMVSFGSITSVNIEFDKPSPLVSFLYEAINKIMSYLITDAYAADTYNLKIHESCNPFIRDNIISDYLSVKSAISTGCYPSMDVTMREALDSILKKGIIIQCANWESSSFVKNRCQQACGFAFPSDDVITICLSVTNSLAPSTNTCGCSKSVVLHELVHLVGFWGEVVPQGCEKACFPSCAKTEDKYNITGCECNFKDHYYSYW